MLSSYAPPFAAPRASAAVSAHFVGESARAVCFLKDARPVDAAVDENDDVERLPLLAVGDDNGLALYLPVVSTPEEDALREEMSSTKDDSAPSRGRCELTSVAEIAHTGDVNALRFVSSSAANLLFSASSNGSVNAFRVGADGGSVLTAIDAPQWQALFPRSATALDIHIDRSALVAVAESGEVAWLRFDDGGRSNFSAQVIRANDSSRLPLHGVKMLARESVAVTVGAAPGSQLRLWDINANQNCPVATASDPVAACALTSVETHPTRPELLFTGSDDGRVALWDLRRLDTPFRVEAKHQRAVHALALHQTSPRLLFSGGDDATVLAWDFHHGQPQGEAVEYAKHIHTRGLHVQPLASSFLPWRSLDFHAPSDTLVASSDAQSLLLVRRASHAHRLSLP